MATMGVIGRSRSWRMKAVVVTVGDVVTAAGRPRGAISREYRGCHGVWVVFGGAL
jgi:hypothetical protein